MKKAFKAAQKNLSLIISKWIFRRYVEEYVHQLKIDKWTYNSLEYEGHLIFEFLHVKNIDLCQVETVIQESS